MGLRFSTVACQKWGLNVATHGTFVSLSDDCEPVRTKGIASAVPRRVAAFLAGAPAGADTCVSAGLKGQRKNGAALALALPVGEQGTGR